MQKMQRNSLITVVAIAAIVIATGGFVACSISKCNNFDETSARSPDGKWVATSTVRECPLGLLSCTDYSVFVTLSAGLAALHPIPDPVRILEDDGAAEPPSVTWTGTNEVTLKLADFGTVITSKHEVGNIRIKYVVAKWIWDRLGKTETLRVQEDRDSERLFKAGKMTRDDLQISRNINHDAADERTNFRQWIRDNATVEGEAVRDVRPPR
jgi:hypothetical protein